VLYGVEDGIVGPNFARRAEIAFGALVGPFLVQDAGHFLQWERPEILNGAIRSFCRDLI
jgi:pimeloyl-ACP methyl ester carboxylesterase